MRLSMKFDGPERAVLMRQINVSELRPQQADFVGQRLRSGRSTLRFRAVRAGCCGTYKGRIGNAMRVG
jgi:hypothetical protein